jgi:hypothetical protein
MKNDKLVPKVISYKIITGVASACIAFGNVVQEVVDACVPPK